MLANPTTTPSTIADLIRSVNVHVAGTSSYQRFKRMYRNDRIAFVYDILPSFGRTMADYQEEILGYFDEGYTRVAVRGPHGLGKTAIASILTHHSVLTAESDCKVPTTASAWRQLEKYLWPEIKKSCKFLEWMDIGRSPYSREELLTLSIKLNQGTVEAFAVASDDHTTIEGAHASRIVYVFDEAKTIPRATWNAAEGAFSSEGLLVSNYQVGVEEDVVELPGALQKAYISDSPIDLSMVGNGIGSIRKDKIVSLGRSSGSNRGSSVYSDVGVAVSTHDVSGKRSRESMAVSNSTPPPLLAPGDTITDSAIDDHRTSSIIPTAGSIYEAIAFAISTPGDPSGQFYDIHMKRPGYEDWHTRHVTVDEAIRAGRISRKWVDQRRVQWGQDSSVFQNRVLGEFADNTEEGIIPLSWIRMSNERWREWASKDFVCTQDTRGFLGVDVARGGEDKTVIAYRYGWGVPKIHIYSKLLTTQTAGHVKVLAAGKKVHIEMDGGLGASVYDMLREQGVKGLVPITVGAPTYYKDRSGELGFMNIRAAMWWHMRELLDPAYGSEIMLPPVDELILDLSTPKWIMMSNGTIKLESKDEIAKRIGRSTDYGDAVCLSFWEASSGGGVVF